MTDRDPSSLLPSAVLSRLFAARDAATDEQEAAAAALFDALLSVGCLTPAEHSEAYLEGASDVADVVSVRVVGFGWLQVSVAGDVDAIPE